MWHYAARGNGTNFLRASSKGQAAWLFRQSSGIFCTKQYVEGIFPLPGFNGGSALRRCSVRKTSSKAFIIYLVFPILAASATAIDHAIAAQTSGSAYHLGKKYKLGGE